MRKIALIVVQFDHVPGTTRRGCLGIKEPGEGNHRVRAEVGAQVRSRLPISVGWRPIRRLPVGAISATPDEPSNPVSNSSSAVLLIQL